MILNAARAAGQYWIRRFVRLGGKVSDHQTTIENEYKKMMTLTKHQCKSVSTAHTSTDDDSSAVNIHNAIRARVRL